VAAGKMRTRVQFERQGPGVSNGMGGKVAAWSVLGEPMFVEVTAAAGAETMLAGRLANKEPAEIELRASPFTMEITGSDRLRELDGWKRIWNVRSVRESKRRGYLTFTVETGVAGS
jgi:hypothetical protein